MVDKTIFEPYVIRDENGEIIGINEEAPANAKVAYHIWHEAELDKQRLAELFSNRA